MAEQEYKSHEISALPEFAHTSSLAIQEIFKSYRDKQVGLSGSVAFSEKADGSVVTKLDIEIERAVQTELGKLFPDIPVYGEETGYEGNPAKTFWLIDPIDGTESFINGVPSFTNMAALIHRGETIAGIVYNPMYDDMYTALRGKGAYKNAELINIRDVTPPRIVLCKEKLVESMQDIFNDEGIIYRTPPSGGGSGLMMVAEGLITARCQLRASGFAHDYAPGSIIVEEAGGVLVPIADDSYSYICNSFIACHPSFFQEVTQNVSKLKLLEKV